MSDFFSISGQSKTVDISYQGIPERTDSALQPGTRSQRLAGRRCQNGKVCERGADTGYGTNTGTQKRSLAKGFSGRSAAVRFCRNASVVSVTRYQKEREPGLQGCQARLDQGGNSIPIPDKWSNNWPDTIENLFQSCFWLRKRKKIQGCSALRQPRCCAVFTLFLYWLQVGQKNFTTESAERTEKNLCALCALCGSNDS
jgi:hypothetical protein